MFNKWSKSIKKTVKKFKTKDPIEKLKVFTPLIIGALFFAVALGSIQEKTGTTDEKFHFTRGIMLLTTGDLRLNQHHPYLFNAVVALPGLFDDDLVLPDTDSELWQLAKKDSISTELVNINGGLVEYSKNVLAGPRLVMITISTLFLCLFFGIIKKEFGYTIALLSTLLLATSPTYLAHGRLATTDIPAAMTIFLSAYAFYKYLGAKGDRKRELLYFTLLYFVALLTKYTAVTLLAVYLPLMLLDEQIRGKDWKLALKAGVGKIVKFGLYLALGLFVAYGFKFGSLQDMQYGNPSKVDATYYDLGQLRQYVSPVLADNLQHIYENYMFPFPQYVHGFYENVWKHNFFGHKSFFLGERSNGGWPLYFPIAFSIKEQLATVVLAWFSIIMWGWYSIKYHNAWRNKKVFKYSPLVLVPLLLAFLAYKSSLNLGVRHLLPIFPFLYLLIAVSLKLIMDKYQKGVYVVIAIVILNVASLSISYPNYISYFNEAIRPHTGHMYLRGSNLDWHQNDGLEEALVNDEDRKISNRLEEVAPGEYYIISSTNIYPNPDKTTEKQSWLNREYDLQEIVKTIEWVGNTHIILKLEENPYYQQ